jgi:hypothetical protein
MPLEPKPLRISRKLWFLAWSCEVRKEPHIVAGVYDLQIAIAVATSYQAGWLLISRELRGRAAR